MLHITLHTELCDWTVDTIPSTNLFSELMLQTLNGLFRNVHRSVVVHLNSEPRQLIRFYFLFLISSHQHQSKFLLSFNPWLITEKPQKEIPLVHSGSLTQQQVGLHDANLQVPGSVRDVTQCLLWGDGIFNHSYSWTFPGLDDAATTQWCHTSALLPQTRPGEALDLLSQGLHGKTRRESTRPSWIEQDWTWRTDGRPRALH